MARRWRRIVLGGVGAVVVLTGAAMATFPWWWPGIARGVDGVEIGRVANSGWSTVELRDVRIVREGVDVSISYLRVPAFGIWPARADGADVVARDVRIAVADRPRAEAPAPSARRLVTDLLRLWPTLERWLAAAEVTDLGIVPAAEGASTITLSSVHWSDGRLRATGPLPGREENLTAQVHREGADTLVLEASMDEMEASLNARAHVTEGGMDVSARLQWRENAAAISATFGQEGVLPVRAELDAPDLSVPGSLVGISAYGPIAGSIHGTWSGDSYEATVTGKAAPVDPEAAIPPLEVDVQVSGTTEYIRVQSAQVHIPGVDADLSAPLQISLPEGVPAGSAALTLEIDLARVPQVAASGRVEGRLEVDAGPGVAPSANFSLSGSGLRWRGSEIRSVDVDGHWRAERLEIEQARVDFGESSRLEATVDLALAERSIANAQLSGEISSRALRPWVPNLPEFASVSVEARGSGPWSAPKHSGKLQLKDLAGAPGGGVDGSVDWTGDGIKFIEAGGWIRSVSGIELPFACEATRNEQDGIAVELKELAWRDGRGEWWHLAGPASIELGPERLTVANLRLEGESPVLDLDAEIKLPEAGRVSVVAQQIPVDRLAPLLPGGSVPAVLDRLNVDLHWENGPVRMDGSLRATYRAAGDAAYSVEADYRTESEELVFGAVRIIGQSGVVLQGQGRVPLTVAAGADGFKLRLPKDGEIAVDLSSQSNPGFWDSLAETTGWTVENPALQVELTGTLAEPKGGVRLAVENLLPPRDLAQNGRLPQFTDLFVTVGADADGASIDEAIWRVDGNWVSLRAQAPWPAIRQAREAKGVPWKQMQFSLAADRLPMSIASRAVPRLLAPEGTVSFDIEHKPDQGFSGFLWLADLGVRPVQPLGAVRDIGGRVLLDGYTLTLRNVAAFLGGRPVELGGGADLGNLNHPTFDLHLISSGVPLVRQAGLVVRTGLDLRIQQKENQPALVSGVAELGRSVFVSDLLSILPTTGDVERPQQRPPFFSVPSEPFSDWRLDVRLKGSDFLQIQSPFFRTEISADFKLSGTLAEPRAEGRAWSNEGTIIFPFGNLGLQEAELVLSPEEPYTMKLRAAAETRIYGYDIHLDVSGTARDPRLVFNSEPPISSQQIFLMLSAGELPESEYAFSTSERAQRLAWFVARNLASTFGIGGGSGGDQLTVRSGEDFSRAGSETIYVQYDIDDHWSVVGEKDRFDAYNAGIKYRFFEK